MSHCSGTAQVSTSLVGAGTMYGPPPVQLMTGFVGESVPVFGDAATAATAISNPTKAMSVVLFTSTLLLLDLNVAATEDGLRFVNECARGVEDANVEEVGA